MKYDIRDGYIRGFIAKCAEAGIDAYTAGYIFKRAQARPLPGWAGNAEQFGKAMDQKRRDDAAAKAMESDALAAGDAYDQEQRTAYENAVAEKARAEAEARAAEEAYNSENAIAEAGGRPAPKPQPVSVPDPMTPEEAAAEEAEIAQAAQGAGAGPQNGVPRTPQFPANNVMSGMGYGAGAGALAGLLGTALFGRRNKNGDKSYLRNAILAALGGAALGGGAGYLSTPYRA